MAGAGGALFTFGTVVVGRPGVRRGPPTSYCAAGCPGPAGGLGAAGLAVVAVAAGPWPGASAARPCSVSSAFLTPAFYRVLMTRVPASERGSGAAAFGIMVDLGLGGGPLLFGLIAARGSITTAFAAGAALALAAAVTLRAGARGPAPQAAPARPRAAPADLPGTALRTRRSIGEGS